MAKEDDIITEESQEKETIKNKLIRHASVAKDKVIQWTANHSRITNGLAIGGIIIGVVGKHLLQEAASAEEGDSVFSSSNFDEGMPSNQEELPVDKELLDKYPPGDPKYRKRNSYYADKYGYSNHESYEKAQKFGLMDENHNLTPTGEQYGNWDSTQDGYPYVKWDPKFGTMLSKEREKDQRIRREEYKKKHKGKG